MRERIFQPGDRVQFYSLAESKQLFRGRVDGRLKIPAGVYMVTHDGEKKSRPVSPDRLQAPVTLIGKGWDAA